MVEKLTHEERLTLLEASSSGLLDFGKVPRIEEELGKRALSSYTDTDLCKELKKRGFEVQKWDDDPDNWDLGQCCLGK